MKAMVLDKIKTPLQLVSLATPEASSDEILVKVLACGICRTDLHVIDGELPDPKLPLILGHQIVGTIEKIGSNVKGFKEGDVVGIPWLHQTCHHCEYCLANKENLCDQALFTGYLVNGGFAEYCIASPEFCFLIPEKFSPVHAAPLLCAGLIGFRAYSMIREVEKIGFFGFGSAAHILIQIANYEGKKIYAFSKEGNKENQEFAKSLGAFYAGSSTEKSPELLDAAIIFASDGNLIPTALKALKKGGKLICAGIHMSEIPAFSYDLLWEERSIQSVANLTKQDGIDFFHLLEKIPVKTDVTVFKLEEANEAIKQLRNGKINGSAVIQF